MSAQYRGRCGRAGLADGGPAGGPQEDLRGQVQVRP
jgi:hypothetical protein